MLCSLCGFDNPAASPRCRSCGAAIRVRADATQTPDALPTGAVLIGNYTVEEVLGQGGFGITYRCHDGMLDRRVAVKEFFPSDCRRTGTDVGASSAASDASYREGRAQFLAEARLLARCHHAGIVGVHAAFEANRTAYMVMELLHGKSLAQLITARGGRLEEAEAVGIIELAGAALGFVHDLDLLHRDIKPDNIMVCDDGRVMLIDFGTAREFVGAGAQGHTVVVTPGYAPLEQYAKQARRGPFTDIYGLAATLYHLLTGQMPPAASDRAMGVSVRPVREINPRISAPVARAVETGLQMEVAKRPQSVGEFLGLLRAPDKAVAALTPAMQAAIDRVNAQGQAALSQPEPMPWDNFAQALQARQGLLDGVLPDAAQAANNAQIAPVPSVKLAPPTLIAGKAMPVSASTMSSLGASGTGGISTAPVKKTGTWGWWVLGVFGFFWLLSAVGSSTPNGYDAENNWSPSYQVQPPNSYSQPPVVAAPRPNPATAKKRAAAVAAWNGLPVLAPVSMATLLPAKSGASGSAQPLIAANGAVKFSPDGQRLAIVDGRGVAQVLSVPGRKVIRTLKLDSNNKVEELLFSPDNQTIAIAQVNSQVNAYSDRTLDQVSVWSVESGQRLGIFTAKSDETVQLQAVTDEGEALLRTRTAAGGGAPASALFKWDPATKKRAKAPFADVPNWEAGALSPGGREFLVGDNKGNLQWFGLRTGRRVARGATPSTVGAYQKIFGEAFTGPVNAPLGIRGIDYAPNGAWVATRNDAGISVFNSRHREVGALDIDARDSTLFALAPGGQWLAARGNLPYAPEGNLLWNPVTGQKIRLQAPADVLLDWSFSPGGKQLYGVFADPDGRSFRLATWRPDAPPLAAFKLEKQTAFKLGAPAHPIIAGSTVALSHSGKLLAMMSSSRPAIEIRRRDGTLVNTLSDVAFNPKLMEFSPDESLLAYVPRGNDATVQVWSVKGARGQVSFQHGEAVTALAFSPDGKRLVVGGSGGSLRWFELASSQSKTQQAGDQPVAALAVTPTQLTVLDNLATRTYALPLSDAAPRVTEQTEFPNLMNQIRNTVGQWTISPDGQLLATAQIGEPVQIWDLTTSSLLQSLPNSPNERPGAGGQAVYGLSFSPDGTRLTALARVDNAGNLALLSWSRKGATRGKSRP